MDTVTLTILACCDKQEARDIVNFLIEGTKYLFHALCG